MGHGPDDDKALTRHALERHGRLREADAGAGGESVSCRLLLGILIVFEGREGLEDRSLGVVHDRN